MAKLKQYPFHTVEIYYNHVDSNNANKTVYGYPVDIEKDTKVAKTAIRNSRRYNSLTKSYVDGESVLVDNMFEDIKLGNLCYPNNGFKYNVIIEAEGKELTIELDDSDFNNFLQDGGTIENKVLKGKWRFINRNGARLVHVGGKQESEYKLKNEGSSLANVEKVKKSTLKLGGIYKSKPEINNMSPERSKSILEMSIYLGQTYSIKSSWRKATFDKVLKHTFLHVTLYKSRVPELEDGERLISKCYLSVNSTKSIPSLYTGFEETDEEKSLRDSIVNHGIGNVEDMSDITYNIENIKASRYLSGYTKISCGKFTIKDIYSPNLVKLEDLYKDMELLSEGKSISYKVNHSDMFPLWSNSNF